ncbi:CP2 transcription factor-domain-containing protein [Emericellopsis atlantica]|uniref:CP2 transcription factor-domain-containing protein n=1 Tax=Emericellopsis atlantica TaxID=2614577 RepID=A0A9P7ZER4_9HYPO|nr:CP2 transcription factor-domain-containing protein [Emericellopsis atlantica]KAG9250601.1 CP2 transcription factor-domain-containing protein [Emericellopsis atlantica]
MFRQRRSSQKPADALLANFRQQFPELGVAGGAQTDHVAADNNNDATLGEPQEEGAPHMNNAPFHDHDPTPRASNEPWRFTPSLMDPNSFSFNTFANAQPGYYTPTPGGTNTLFFTQQRDLQTPVGMTAPGLETPLSMSAAGAMNTVPGVMDIGGFQPLQPHQMHHFNPFVTAPPPQSFAPSSFVHQDTGYETMDADDSPIRTNPSDERMPSIDSAFQEQTPMMAFQQGHMPSAAHFGAVALPMSAENFRFHSTLNAPTAMIKQADEIPVTYLNKGQAYQLSIIDTRASLPLAPGTKFRTFVRVSFEDDEQRQKPGVCWSLWKEGRGANEAHQRGGRLQAVEYVEAGQPGEGDDKRTKVELESASFDGFSVVWTPGAHGQADVNIAVRFNFLSTDFSHSKGVKGIPVRLCSKTTALGPDPAQQSPTSSPAEVCYCKVKLFRDHGAERKLSNDVAHVKKSIDKVKHTISQVESGMKDFSKRKRGGGGFPGKPKMEMQRPGKVQKHKRTWSMSSASSADGGHGGQGARSHMEDDLHVKLRTLQDMFSSPRPVSVLYLRGEEHDDPDAHPVVMAGEEAEAKAEAMPRDGTNWQARGAQESNTASMVSPAPSSLSIPSQSSGVAQGHKWQNLDGISTGESTQKGPDQSPIKIQKTDEEGKLSGWIEALGVDPSYRPPPEQTPKPSACFYMLRRENKEAPPAAGQLHHAVYLYERSLAEFNRRVAHKFGVDASRIEQTIHVLQSGLEVVVDDDVVLNLREGQDMTLDIDTAPASVKREWDMAVDEPLADETTTTTTQAPAPKLVLRVAF